MSGRFPRAPRPAPAGHYRLVLTYADAYGHPARPPRTPDIVEARFVDPGPLVHWLVQAVDFISDDPAPTLAR